ncbi:ABC transporter ATP-binding protein [Parapusillimonas sp. JC17]|uniref:ABC transporter ATP-binding protein n=1 Tax=Parapusillimonas sp. JC17 TaxID=3445768 RepID=UPI003FA10676
MEYIDAGHDGTVLRIEDLSVRIASEAGVSLAVKSLALAIERGQTFALVGESGCGKSMTALALLRLLPDAGSIASGRVFLGGTELNGLTEQGMRSVRGGQIGIIFQEPSTSLNPVMTIGQQLAEVIRTHTEARGRQVDEKAAWWLRRVGIADPEKRLGDYPFQFSGGQKQRIMIAIALAAGPRLLIADEPTTALDVTVQAQILALLADIQKEMGLAIMLITHDLAVVKNVADYVALMRAGEIVETMDAASFFSAPRHPYARELLAAIPTFEKRGRPLAGARMPAGVGAPLERAGHAGQGNILLSVQGLSVAYSRSKGLLQRRAEPVTVVRDVSFDLRAGETLALLGESGCGKTTTAKALIRLLDKQAIVRGRATLQGEDLLSARGAHLRRIRRSIQIVFQDPYASLDPRMMVGDILEEGISALRPDRSRTQRANLIRSLIDRVGLPANTVERYPHEFSGGQRQRVAIARALAVEPSVLICDEPTSALDVSVQAQILDLLQDLQRELNIAYLFITHNFGVVEYLADRIAIMHGGAIIEEGTAEAVLKSPRRPETRRLLDAVPRLS